MPSPVPALDVCLLGTFTAAVYGRPVTSWRAGKARQLFQLLLLERGQLVRKEHLQDALWPDAEGRAASSLRVAVHELRQILTGGGGHPPAARLHYRDVGYALEVDNLRLDVNDVSGAWRAGHDAKDRHDPRTALAHFARAGALYRGDLLPDEPAPWVDEHRQWVRTLVLDALTELRTDAVKRSDPAAVARWCRAVVAVDAYSEPSYRLLMAVGRKRGQLGEVEDWYAQCRHRLAELGAQVDSRTHRVLALARDELDGAAA